MAIVSLGAMEAQENCGIMAWIKENKYNLEFKWHAGVAKDLFAEIWRRTSLEVGSA